MKVDWRKTLTTLLNQFESRASRSNGLNHLMIEGADHERDKLSGPPWFQAEMGGRVVNGKQQLRDWSWTALRGLPSIAPSFREPSAEEVFQADSQGVIRDLSGAVRAVAVRMKIRQGYFCGRPSEEVAAFESLANSAASALCSADDLSEHPCASELVDLFRKPRGGIRYIFGDVSEQPREFISRGWQAGVLQFENGVLVDLPISESEPASSHWVLLLHRLGWRNIPGSGLSAQRRVWDGNVEHQFGVDWHQLHGDSDELSSVSSDSFYSVLGTKDAPVDLFLASALAIRILISEYSQVSPPLRSDDPSVDYSKEKWNLADLPSIRVADFNEISVESHPTVGLIVATDVERLAVLKRLRPARKRRSVLQIFREGNTFFIGRLGSTDVILCMTAMGSMGRDSSTIVTTELLQTWAANMIIMPGIAFGREEGKQQIGQVLVSDRVISYEPERIGVAAQVPRGDETLAGVTLLNRFRNILGWNFSNPNGKQCGFQVGPLLSGEKLVDDLDYKKSLFAKHPTAIGGEMEGAGIAAAASRKGCEWVVVKSICDWGDGTKSKVHQGFAAASSVSFIEHVLNQPGALAK